MSRNELIAKIEALNEWEAVIEEAKAEAEPSGTASNRKCWNAKPKS